MVAPFVADADRNRDINLVELRPVTQAHADSVVGIVLVGHRALPSCTGEVGSLYSGVQSQAFPDIEVGGNGNGQVMCLDGSILELVFDIAIFPLVVFPTCSSHEPIEATRDAEPLGQLFFELKAHHMASCGRSLQIAAGQVNGRTGAKSKAEIHIGGVDHCCPCETVTYVERPGTCIILCTGCKCCHHHCGHKHNLFHIA